MLLFQITVNTIASGGSDGVITLWNVNCNPKTSTREDQFDMRCYLPEWDEEPEYREDVLKAAPDVETIPTEDSNSDEGEYHGDDTTSEEAELGQMDETDNNESQPSIEETLEDNNGRAEVEAKISEDNHGRTEVPRSPKPESELEGAR